MTKVSQNCIFPQSTCIGRPFGAPLTTNKVQPKIALLSVILYHVQGDHWSSADKVVPKTGLSTFYLYRKCQPFGEPMTEWNFSPVPGTGGPFGAPKTMWYQKLHYSLIGYTLDSSLLTVYHQRMDSEPLLYRFSQKHMYTQALV